MGQKDNIFLIIISFFINRCEVLSLHICIAILCMCVRYLSEINWCLELRQHDRGILIAEVHGSSNIILNSWQRWRFVCSLQLVTENLAPKLYKQIMRIDDYNRHCDTLVFFGSKFFTCSYHPWPLFEFLGRGTQRANIFFICNAVFRWNSKTQSRT